MCYRRTKLKSFKTVTEIADLMTDNMNDVTPENGVYATIKNEGNFMHNLSEAYNDPDAVSWFNHQGSALLNFKPLQEAHIKHEAFELSPEKREMEAKHHTMTNYDQHRPAIRDYTGGSTTHNSTLWRIHTGTLPKELATHDMREHIGPLDRALKANKLTSDVDTYSSTRHDPRKMKNENGVVHHPAFLSTSVDPFVAVRKENNAEETELPNGKTRVDHHILHIPVPKGHKGFYVGDNGDYTRFTHEKEVILPRGMKMKHEYTDSYKHPKHDLHMHIHHMSIIQKGKKNES